MSNKVDQALAVFKENYAFFVAPLNNQDDFKRWLAKSKHQEQLLALSSKLSIALRVNCIDSSITEYMDALIGKTLEPDDIQNLTYGDESRLRSLLVSKPNLVDVILNNADNDAIKEWNDDHSEDIDRYEQMSEIIKNTSAIFENITIMKEKANNLRSRGYYSEAKIAERLTSKVIVELKNFIEEPTQDNLDGFRAKTKLAISTARPALNKHRGWNHILGNLLIAITTFGAGFLAKKAITGKGSFFNTTDSGRKIDKLSEGIESIKPKA